MPKKLIRSFKFAIAGIKDLFTFTRNSRIHLFFAFLSILLGLYFKISTIEWCVVILCIALVIMAEAFNTSIEYLTDLVTKEKHDLARKTKDVAAGAVMIAAISAAVVGIIIFLPKLMALFS